MNPSHFGTAMAPALSSVEALLIAEEIYIYAYPAVLMELTRRVMTHAAEPDPVAGRAPMNQFVHFAAFPDASFTDVVRPNADTLYSILWYDVSAEPLLIQVPDCAGRYCLLPLLDMWTDVYASPGTRTTGSASQAYAIVGPGWTGALPSGVQPIHSPTGIGWLIGRTQTNGPTDCAAVHRFQAGLIAMPLSADGSRRAPARAQVDADVNLSAPVEQIAGMDAGAFFEAFMALLDKNPPHPTDAPIVMQMARLGLARNTPFRFVQAAPQTQAALSAAMTSGWQRVKVDAINIKVGAPVGG